MTENKKAHFMTHRYKYRARGPGQPPQLPSANGTGYCVQTGMRITTFAPERPFSVQVWPEYAHLERQALRNVPTSFCHHCPASYSSTYADVICDKCKAEYPRLGGIPGKTR